MTEIVLFHHIQGLTSGVHAFADRLRAAGHTVHTPDSFEGRTFASIDEGQAYCSEIGFQDDPRPRHRAGRGPVGGRSSTAGSRSA